MEPKELASKLLPPVQALDTELRTLMGSPGRADDATSLKNLARAIRDIEPLAKEASQLEEKEGQEDVKDAGDIIETILTQRLAIPGAREDASLFKAAQDLEEDNPLASDLHKILLSFLQFPAATERMLEEIERLLIDLKKA